MKFARRCAYVAMFVGILRIIEYHFFGDLHRGYAFVWIIHALVTSALILWLAKPEETKRKFIS